MVSRDAVGSHAITNGGGSEGIELLRVDKLAHRRQLVHAVHFVQRWGAVTIQRLRLHQGLFLKEVLLLLLLPVGLDHVLGQVLHELQGLSGL